MNYAISNWVRRKGRIEGSVGTFPNYKKLSARITRERIPDFQQYIFGTLS